MGGEPPVPPSVQSTFNERITALWVKHSATCPRCKSWVKAAAEVGEETTDAHKRNKEEGP